MDLKFRMNKTILSVSRLNNYIKGLFDDDILLNDVFVVAEIANFKAHQNGHFYFSLREDDASVSCVMWKSFAESLSFMPEDGMKALVYGRVTVYEKTGQYQLYCESMEPIGVGAQFAALSQVKDRLKKEGLFDAEYKQLIPEHPVAVGIITSGTGSVIRDIIRVSRRRNRTVKLYLFPVSVQGRDAPSEIAKAVAFANIFGQDRISTLIVARGGGSAEDLSPFNTEEVVRAIFASRIPVVSAVGHETDTTLADYAADARAATPSEAAELTVPSLDLSYDLLLTLHKRMTDAVAAKASSCEEEIVSLAHSVKTAIKNASSAKRAELVSLLDIMERVSPMAVMKRGFMMAEKDGVAIEGVSDVAKGDKLKLRAKDGEINVSVVSVKVNRIKDTKERENVPEENRENEL